MKINFALARSPETVVCVQPSVTDEAFLQPNHFFIFKLKLSVWLFKKKKTENLFQKSDFLF